jgi:hypothetical protein
MLMGKIIYIILAILAATVICFVYYNFNHEYSSEEIKPTYEQKPFYDESNPAKMNPNAKY